MYIYYFSHKWPKYWRIMEGQNVPGLALLARLELESWGWCSKLWNFSNFPDVSWIQIHRSGACNLLNSGQRWALTKNWPALFVAMRLSPHWVSLHLPGNQILNTQVTLPPWDCVTSTEGASALVYCGVCLFPPPSVGLILGITTWHLVSCDAILST